MMAMRLRAAGAVLAPEEVPEASPREHEVLLQVLACGVCRTDLHLVDGELPHAHFPITPGHEIVARVIGRGACVQNFQIGDRVGVPWLAHTCGVCAYCRAGAENLCDSATFTGYTVDGGYAQCAVADARYCLRLPARYADVEAAPLLCAGLIGYRAYRAAGAGTHLGLFGFGAAAHLLAPARRIGRYSRSRAPGTWRASALPGRSARPGPAHRTRCLRSRWMPRSFLRRSGVWCRPHCGRCAKAVASYALEST
jgi:alcohol dehydrogenase, propanol-preferring